MSTKKNNIVVDDGQHSLFPRAGALHSSAVSYNQGDLLILDTTNHLIALAAAEADYATMLGVATETVVNGKLLRPYTTDVDASQAAQELPGPALGVVVSLIAKTGDAFVPGQLVYGNPTAGAQNVQTAGTKAIGVYLGASITAVAGQRILVKIGARYPGDALVIS